VSEWPYRVEFRGDPVLGAYGYVEQGNETGRIACRPSAAFDGTSYRMRVPLGCVGNPDRVRFVAYVQRYDDSGTDIIGADYAPAFDIYSD
jgi:hypothetical protein